MNPNFEKLCVSRRDLLGLTMGYYAGIGSRSTPPEVQLMMTQLAKALSYEGWVLRSGGACGADTAFEIGVPSPCNRQIFLPSRSFNGRSSDDIGM